MKLNVYNVYLCVRVGICNIQAKWLAVYTYIEMQCIDTAKRQCAVTAWSLLTIIVPKNPLTQWGPCCGATAVINREQELGEKGGHQNPSWHFEAFVEFSGWDIAGDEHLHSYTNSPHTKCISRRRWAQTRIDWAVTNDVTINSTKWCILINWQE